MGRKRIPHQNQREVNVANTFQEHLRCPQCLRLGEMRYQYGNYCCDYCDRCYPADWIGAFMRAFEAGREFERGNGQSVKPPASS